MRNDAWVEYEDEDGTMVEFMLESEQDDVLAHYGDSFNGWAVVLGDSWMEDRIPDYIWECLSEGWC